ncbi:carboxylesterase from carbohydrate esterase [Dacryopinax primogenitus]|uniref:Carboxylic ester hydrolase n=1 Tax=Dacryopinax primogenitus (strain DJM 731) TaxID=1858805 RepID=M5G7G1_DACPD|nr:carboxylesterase from carbohydrate esterase [Dacryopinax primogenitus]EJT99692.1 carboxylesterase from carbohydrate esterase [Dacryopinax primogenitus]
MEDFSAALGYLEYSAEAKPFEKFWIREDDGVCYTISADGAIVPTSCYSSYRALCSQSAEYYATPSSANEITVHSKELTVTGYRNQLSFRFLGIPYANQPERFTYSTLYTGSPTLNATKYGSACLQTGRGSEDCLYLNIWTPYLPLSSNPSTSALKPVHVYIHGGAYTSGAGSDYDGGVQVSRGDIVVVTINYRLTTLGFLALGDGTTNGNFGLADMVTALDWVQNYITAFGGDPARVTITGGSAGAGAVRALMESPMAIGKFAAAAPQSNLDGMLYASTYSVYYTIPQEVAVAADPILAATGCNTTENDPAATLACLRAYNATELVYMSNVARYVVVDGTYITSTELPVNGSGPVADVHLMMGSMSDDGNSFIAYLKTTDLSQAITSQITCTTLIIDSGLFPQPNSGNTTLDVFNVTARISTDIQFRCLDQATVVALSKHDLMKSIWVYQFNRGYNGYDPNGLCYAPAATGYPYGNPELPHFNCHSGDLAWVFGYVGQPGNPFRDENDYIFQQTIVDQWTSFFRTYNPNPASAYLTARNYTTTAQQLSQNGQWQALTDYQSPTLHILAQPSYPSAFLEQPQCNFFNYPLSYYG